jgi:hypothetical protein
MIIDKINKKGVCAQANATKAKRLQELFNEEPIIYENTGPGLNTVTDRHGVRRSISQTGDKCEPIYISIQPE